MKPADRARLTAALREHVAKIAADLRAKMRAPAVARDRARQLHLDEQVAEDFDVWTDLLSRRAAVLWLLKSVYVRVLEDRGLLNPGRLIDLEAQQLFERLAPHLGETAFLRWIYRDLASADGGLPELFSPQPAEVALPSDERSRALITFWRDRDADTEAQWSFANEHFDGELMGDLYQELDPVVKDRFALCQTPDFVREFILDRTLTPAIETFGADQVRLLDPACGSGHFLIDGLKRLVAATAAQHPDWSREQVVAQTLDRVVGIDLNDYACALARTRLVMTAAELAGVTTLADAAQFHPHVYWADGLEQVERDDATPSTQFALFGKVEEKTRATLTRSDVRAALKTVLETKFHAVVANPPYITEKDAAHKDYHREKIGKTARYVSAYGEYSLASPFTERCFQLAEKDGYAGIIAGNNFMKRGFGKPLIEKVLAGVDLSLVVDASQAYIPYHGTPTVLLFGRNRRPVSDVVHAVMGKRGEVGTPADPAMGRVWSSIVEGWHQVGFENEFVSVAELPRKTLARHPWSLGGGGAAELKVELERVAQHRLKTLVEVIGFGAITRADEVFILPLGASSRLQMAPDSVASYGFGEALRDWSFEHSADIVFPYSRQGIIEVKKLGRWIDWAWRNRQQLWGRQGKGFKTKKESGGAYYEYSMFYPDRHFCSLRIAFAFVATHNHFILDRGGTVFNRSAPIIKLRAGATKDDHLALLGVLNSSVACFWMKQVFHAKGGVDRCQVEAWDIHFEFDGTKLKSFPVASDGAGAQPYAAMLDQLGRQRADRSPSRILTDGAWANAAGLRQALDDRRTRDREDLFLMVGLQEELDWLCYRLYGLHLEGDVVGPDMVEAHPPTWLPWCLNLATREANTRTALGGGDGAGEVPTVWFTRHGWEPVLELPAEVSTVLRARIEARRERIRVEPALALIETPNFKRRWYRPDYDVEEKDAFYAWLADRVEAAAKDRGAPFSLEQMVADLQGDARVLAVCEVLTGRRDLNLSQIIADVLSGDAVPSHRFHVYKPAGLIKREAWEHTWEDQRREDAGENVTPEVPPAYDKGDFLKSDYWGLRGKLDVPKERCIAFTEVPGRSGADTLYGWAGWTPLQRLKAILAIDEDLEDAGVPLADRVGLLDSAWRLLPDVAREDAAVATRLKAELQALVGPDGPSRELVEDWRTRFPPPKARAGKAERPAAARDEDDAEERDLS